jgi:hypothetical protein
MRVSLIASSRRMATRASIASSISFVSVPAGTLPEIAKM